MKVSVLLQRLKEICKDSNIDLQRLVPMSKSSDRGTLLSFYGRENDNTYVCVRKIGGVPVAYVFNKGIIYYKPI